jgi:hypothetical protein
MSFFMIGCPTRSLFPLFSEKEVVFNPALIGTWSGEDDEGTFSFVQSGEKGYTVTMRDEKGEKEVYSASLGRLGKYWFMDSSPASDERDYHLITAHLITKIQLDGDTLRMSLLESDWLRGMIDEKKLSIAHVRRDGEIILTASTEELQALLRRIAKDQKAFPDPIILARMK